MQKCIYDSYLEMYYKLTSSYLFTDPFLNIWLKLNVILLLPVNLDQVDVTFIWKRWLWWQIILVQREQSVIKNN